ncbi:hypothetical protein SAMN05216553_105171 [Lentzea fradiae]|uniref:Uncharacterized protein n=1 Tax=Lentzea fradiae TaxID=200378 RepID=A0A1G7R7H5_9PSEU|nr:hypothetical protein [Lentzea fradiae]SDG06741.1 hypothetical protein SAMN05216553_105171 [Lentzea fradiae]
MSALSIQPCERIIVAVGMAATTRGNWMMAYFRDAMVTLVEQAFVDSEVVPEFRHPYVDRGGHLMVLIRPTDRIPKTLLLTRFVPRLRELLEEHNAVRPHPLRLKVVIHPGDVTCDYLGWFGEDIDIATGLLTALILEDRGEHLVLVVSDQIHRSVIRHGYDGIDERAFVPLPRVEVAGEECKGWVHVPGEP